MGCSSSVVSPAEGATKDAAKSTDLSNNNKHKNGHTKNSEINNKSLEKKHSFDKNSNKLNSLAQTPVPKSVAFDVTLDGISGDGLLTVKKRPPKLQTLEPLNIPKLTAEQLEEKQKLADEKREKLKQGKINLSQKSSKRRRELLEAREFGVTQLSEQKKEIMDNMKQAELQKQQRLTEIGEQQKVIEEKVKKARERAKSIENLDDVIEVETDEGFNATNDENWLAISSKTNIKNVEEEYGLQKKVGQLKPAVSSSIVDSYDTAFMRGSTKDRQTLQPVHNLLNNVNVMSDDFFDS